MMPLSTNKQGNPSYDIENDKPVIKSAPKPAWNKHGNLTGMAADINDLGAGVNENMVTENDGTKNINKLDNVNIGGLGSDFKINTFDILKKDIPYINNINSINKPEQNKNILFPNTKQDNNKITPYP